MTKLRIELELIVEDAHGEWSMKQVREWVQGVLDQSQGERLTRVKRVVLEEEVPDADED